MSEATPQKITDVELEDIEEILRIYYEEGMNLIGILQRVQEKYHFLPNYVLTYVAEKLKIPLARLYSIASFYAQFSFTPKGKYVITLCDGTACHVKGSMLLVELINQELHIKPGETTPDGFFTIETVSCFGCCAIAPVAFVNKDVFGSLTVSKMRNIVNKIRKEEGLV
jgi:NADH:ubiquinone oxidoreductase subunit E